MTRVTSTTSARTRVGAWLLITSLPAFVLVPIVNVSVFSANGIGLFADITPEQMAALGGQWTIAVLTVFLAAAIGNVGILLTSLGVASRPWAALAAVVAVIAIALAAADAAIRISAAQFTEARLGDSSAFAAAEVASNAAFAASALGIVALSVTLFTSGRHRTAGIVLGILGGVVFLLSLVAYAFIPPFLLALLWLPLGIIVLRGRGRAAVSG